MQAVNGIVQSDWDAYAEEDSQREACSSLFFDNMKALYSLERHIDGCLLPHFDPDFGKEKWIGFLAECAFLKGKIVIDSGCGTGRDAVVAAAFGAKVYAFDGSEEAIRNLNKRCSRNRVKNRVEAYVARAPKEINGLELADFVHLSDVVSYRDERFFAHFMEEHMDLVKPGGFMSVDFFGERHFKAVREEGGLTFLSQEEVYDFFDKKQFTIIHSSESFGPRMLSDQTVENWHIINVLAQKR